MGSWSYHHHALLTTEEKLYWMSSLQLCEKAWQYLLFWTLFQNKDLLQSVYLSEELMLLLIFIAASLGAKNVQLKAKGLLWEIKMQNEKNNWVDKHETTTFKQRRRRTNRRVENTLAVFLKYYSCGRWQRTKNLLKGMHSV